MIKDLIPQKYADTFNSDSSLTQALTAFREGISRDLKICFPASIISYNRATRIATVMPLIKAGYFTGKKWEFIRRQTFEVYVRQISCGGITFDIPLYVGDTGWVISSDRDTSLLKQEGTLTKSVLAEPRTVGLVENEYQQIPSTPTLHELRHGFFIPDCWAKFEYHRFKDDPSTNVGSGCYLGSSIDTMDELFNIDRTLAEDGYADEKYERKYQEGDAYEKKTTSSIVVEPGVGVSVASSTPVKNPEGQKITNKNRNAIVRVGGDEILVSANDLGDKDSDDWTQRTMRISLSTQNGISVICAGENSEEKKFQEVQMTLLPDSVSAKMTDSSNNAVTVTMKGGCISLQTTADMNINTLGKLNLRAKDGINLQSDKDSNISVEGNANIHATGNVNVSASGDARVNSIGNTDIASSGKTRITAGDTMINAAGDVMISGGSNVKVNAGSLIDINTKYADVNIKTQDGKIGIESEKGDVNIKTEVGKIDIESVRGEHINMTTGYGNINVKTSRGDVKVSADSAEVDVFGSKSVKVTSDGDAIVRGSKSVSVSTGGNATVSGSRIILDSKQLEFLGNNITLKEHKIDKDNTAYYVAWK